MLWVGWSWSCIHKFKCKFTHAPTAHTWKETHTFTWSTFMLQHLSTSCSVPCLSPSQLPSWVERSGQAGGPGLSIAWDVLYQTRNNTGSTYKTSPWLFYEGALQPPSVIPNANRTQIIDKNSEICWKMTVHWRDLGNNLGGVVAGKKQTQMAFGYNMLGKEKE